MIMRGFPVGFGNTHHKQRPQVGVLKREVETVLGKTITPDLSRYFWSTEDQCKITRVSSILPERSFFVSSGPVS